LISGGIYVFSPEVLRLIPADQRYDMPSLFNDLTVNNLSAVPFFLREYWLDIGHLEDLAQARRDFHQIFVDE
jgi:NDP-sugar pyrophosphorylase family protein